MFFHHIGIFVESIEKGRIHLDNLQLDLTWSEVYDDSDMGVFVQFGRDASGINYEIIAPNGARNPVSGSLESRRNILNHLAYSTSHFDKEVNRLIHETGCIAISQSTPAVAFGGKRVQFFINPLNHIIELVEVD